jgi:hypothetical protein
VGFSRMTCLPGTRSRRGFPSKPLEHNFLSRPRNATDDELSKSKAHRRRWLRLYCLRSPAPDGIQTGREVG